MFYFLNFPQVFSHSLIPCLALSLPLLPTLSFFFYLSLWKIPLILGSGFEQKLWAKRLILALIPLARTIIKVLNWFLGGYVFFIAGCSKRKFLLGIFLIFLTKHW